MYYHNGTIQLKLNEYNYFRHYYNKNSWLKTISIKTIKKIKFNLLYDQNRSLQKKIKIEQLRNETK